MLEHTSASAAPSARNADALRPGRVGVIGATSLVGICLLPMLVESGWQVLAFSRGKLAHRDDGVERRQLPSAGDASPLCTASKSADVIPCWICVAPIWVLAEHFALLESCSVRRVVVLSSTSRFTKDSSSNPQEQALARSLADAETSVQAWAESHGVEWMILRPTLIYGMGADKNVTEIVHFIRRFGFFPLLGKATGLRQPIHVADVATVCVSALQTSRATNRDLNISGGETLTYHDMVARIFTALNRRPLLLTVPLGAFQLAVALLRRLPRYSHWSAAMAERMNRDLVFDHTDAARELDFKPRAFQITAEDLPP